MEELGESPLMSVDLVWSLTIPYLNKDDTKKLLYVLPYVFSKKLDSVAIRLVKESIISEYLKSKDLFGWTFSDRFSGITIARFVKRRIDSGKYCTNCGKQPKYTIKTKFEGKIMCILCINEICKGSFSCDNCKCEPILILQKEVSWPKGKEIVKASVVLSACKKFYLDKKSHILISDDILTNGKVITSEEWKESPLFNMTYVQGYDLFQIFTDGIPKKIRKRQYVFGNSIRRMKQTKLNFSQE